MKLVKMSVLALAMGLFVASCGNGKTEEAHTDTMTPPPAEMPAATPPVDTTMKPVDTMNKTTTTTTTPATTTTETKMETKKK